MFADSVHRMRSEPGEDVSPACREALTMDTEVPASRGSCWPEGAAREGPGRQRPARRACTTRTPAAQPDLELTDSSSMSDDTSSSRHTGSSARRQLCPRYKLTRAVICSS